MSSCELYKQSARSQHVQGCACLWLCKHHKGVCGVQVVREARRPGTVRSFLDSTQYSTTSILRYERIFGSGFVSTGGIETTKVSTKGLGLSIRNERFTLPDSQQHFV